MRIYIIISMAIVLSACGYHIGREQTAAPGGITSVAVPVFENKTREPELGAMLADALRADILRRKAVALKGTDSADAVVRGIALDVRLDPLSFDNEGFTTAYRVRLRVNVRLEKNGEIIWRADNIERDEQIIVANAPLDNALRREFALSQISEDLAEQIHTMMLETF